MIGNIGPGDLKEKKETVFGQDSSVDSYSRWYTVNIPIPALYLIFCR